jgi:hypothetical protein
MEVEPEGAAVKARGENPWYRQIETKKSPEGATEFFCRPFGACCYLRAGSSWGSHPWLMTVAPFGATLPDGLVGEFPPEE